MRGHKLSLPIVGGLAGAAMLVAHWLAYLLAAPDGHERAELLATSGHAYWLYLAAAGLAGGVLGLGGFVRTRLRAGDDAGHPLIFGGVRLGLFQVASFVALESAERLATGHDFASTFMEPVVLIGIALQLAVALFGALLLAAVARVIELVRAQAPRFLRAEQKLPYPVTAENRPRPLVAVGGSTLRGPPILVRI